MDPAKRFNSIIGSACVALISSVGRTVADVTNFIRRCRSARADLAAVTRELSELQMVLELLNDYGQRYAVPVELQSHLRPIITNCTTVVLRISGVLRRHGEGVGPPRWTSEGKKEVNDLQNSLEVHRGALGLVSDLISIIIARATRNQGCKETQGEQLKVHEVIKDLQGVMSSILVSDSNATLARQHFALQVHLGQIIAYAQTIDKSDTDDWEEAVRSIDANASAATPEPVSPMASIRGTSSYFGDGAVDKPQDIETGFEPVSPMESRELLDAERKASNTLTVPSKPLRTVPHLTIGGSPTNTFGPPLKSPDSVSPMTYKEPPQTSRTADTLHVAGQESEPISPMSLGQPASVEPTRETSRETYAPPPEAPRNVESDKEVVPGTLSPMCMAASKVSTARPSYEDEEITEEALAFAQVPVHIMGRLSLNLVGHVYTNKSGASGGSDETSFQKSFSTIATAEEQEEAEADGYAHSTATSDTGSLRDGHLQFSQMDVTQIPTQESQSSASPQVEEEQVTESQLPSMSHYQMVHDRPSHEIYEQQSISTMDTHNFLQGKPLPRPPLVYIPGYPGPFARKKVVVVGNFSCGKTCLITRMSKGTYPKNKNTHNNVTETVKVSVDDEPVELSLWDIRGIDYDPAWLNDAQVALWVTEVNRNCPTAAIILVGLKSDIRWHAKTVEKLRKHGKTLVTPEQGEQLRESIGAVRYLECSARTGDGVLEVLEEATRTALQVKNEDYKRPHRRPLSRIGKFFGIGGHRVSDSLGG
ncbi:hypothetical protein VMCG_03444 [Cytospora schulzeri]|uniref:Fungal N-terminal domain-containing protein n=1 Tax=Cytospora schulzeri TaxID=448051 RepID=A0A423WWR0_9PEZI|nr:hypothetical protein VMCG_03444 [Valsa malicola]